MKSILEKLEENAKKYPDKIVYGDESEEVTYADFVRRAKILATKLAKLNLRNKPVAVFDNRNVKTLIGMFAVMYSGNFYVVLDSKSPFERLEKMYSISGTTTTICEDENLEMIPQTNNANVLSYENEGEIDEELLNEVYAKLISTDPAYILFTSGSTGVPKGTILSHQNLVSYIDWYATEFDINEKTVFGSQTPFYFSASVSDIYSTVYTGATFEIIPKKYFSFPMKLVELLNTKKVNTIYWVPSALCIIANMKLFDYAKPLYLEKVLFIGEVMPNKQLNYWRKNIKAEYYNLFGPTETTDVCTFYHVNREFADDESLPIGKHCNNCDTFIVNEDGKEVTKPGEIGQLYVRGIFVAYGYYNNVDKTSSAFVQNPLQNNYPETVYRTGDLVKLNEYGEYEYLGRADFQIKHMGYRIELGEIEQNVMALEKIRTAVCVYDKDEDVIALIYEGGLKIDALREKISAKVPHYMVPAVIKKVSTIVYNQNGKIDRNYYKNNYKELD